MANAHADASRRVVGAGWFMEYIGDVQVVYMDGRVTDDSFDQYLQTVARDIDDRDGDALVGIVYDVPQPSMLSSSRRSRLAEVLDLRRDKIGKTTSAYAMATPSMVVRGGLKMIFWLAPPPYKNTVVATPREAFEFVAQHHPGLDLAQLAEEYEKRRKAAWDEMGPE